MSKFRNALYRFMYGRNGVDALSWALAVLEVVLSLLSAFHSRARRVAGAVLCVHGADVRGAAPHFFRAISRAVRPRNAKFLTWWTPKANAIRGARPAAPTRRTKYVRRSCGAYCRVRGVGKIELTCPKCGRKKVVKT